MPSGQWQQMRGASNVQVTKRQQLEAVLGNAALRLLSLSAMTKTSVKVLALITCLSALPLMVGLTGCAGDRWNQSTGRSIDDKRTAEPDNRQSTDQGIEDSRTAGRVREALAAGPDYRYDGVKVIAGDGVVQLSGLVNTRDQKDAAGEVASKVVGVKDVANYIKVKE
jgi:osmotically-inducible protein OsmY